MKTSYEDDIARDGFAISQQFIDSKTISLALEALADARTDSTESRWAGKAFGIRNLLNVVPLTRDLANSPACRSIVEPLLGNDARIVLIERGGVLLMRPLFFIHQSLQSTRDIDACFILSIHRLNYLAALDGSKTLIRSGQAV